MSSILGHSRPFITFDAYAHVLPEDDAEAMSKLAEALLSDSNRDSNGAQELGELG